MNIAICITTCSRVDMLQQLLDDIDREMPAGWKHWISVWEDVREDVAYPNDTKIRVDRIGKWTKHCFGVDHYGETIGRQWEQAANINHDRFVFLQDDVRLVPGFFLEAERIWSEIKDDHKAVLNCIRDNRPPGPCWSMWWPVQMTPDVDLTQWMDCAAIYSDEKFLGRVLPIRNRARPPESISSGVGRDLTLHLHWSGLHIYQVRQTLVKHGNHISVMHPHERRLTPIIA